MLASRTAKLKVCIFYFHLVTWKRKNKVQWLQYFHVANWFMARTTISNSRAFRKVKEILTGVPEGFLLPKLSPLGCSTDPSSESSWSKLGLFPIYQFLCIHEAPDTLQSNAMALRHKLPTQPFLGSKQGQLQVHINQIITGSSGTEAMGTLTSLFPRVLPVQLLNTLLSWYNLKFSFCLFNIDMFDC